MKKRSLFFLFGIVVVILVVPQVAFASWWNPLTWFSSWSFFQDSSQNTAALEQKILELEQRINDTTSPNSSAAKEPVSQPEVAPVKKEVPVKESTPVYEEEPAVIPESSTTPDDAGLVFEVDRLTQTIFEETHESWGYGGYEISLAVTAVGGDVLIPMSTSDSTKGLTGFSYSVVGDEYRGEQDSKVGCGVRQESFCKINEGKTSTITVTVWLTPSQAGTYGVKFLKLKASVGGGDFENFDIGEETEHIYVSRTN